MPRAGGDSFLLRDLTPMRFWLEYVMEALVGGNAGHCLFFQLGLLGRKSSMNTKLQIGGEAPCQPATLEA